MRARSTKSRTPSREIYSEANKENVKKHKYFHAAGTKSFADINEEEYEKHGATLDRVDLFAKTRAKKDGQSVNEECASMIAKLQHQKSTQASTSSQSMIASSDDTYAQVFGKERPGRIRGVGTGPTPSSLWGGGLSHAKLIEENRNLAQTVKEVVEKLSKVEALVMEGRNSVEHHASSPMCVQSVASITKSEQVQGRKVILLYLAGEEVGRGIVMSDEKEKTVMGMMLSGVFYEVVVFLAIKPEAPLFVKDPDRKIMRDAVGSHIAWLKDDVRIDLA